MTTSMMCRTVMVVASGFIKNIQDNFSPITFYGGVGGGGGGSIYVHMFTTMKNAIISSASGNVKKCTAALVKPVHPDDMQMYQLFSYILMNL